MKLLAALILGIAFTAGGCGSEGDPNADSATGDATGGSTTGGAGSGGGKGGGAGGTTSGGITSTCTEANETLTDNASGQHCGYTYEYWKDNGTGTLVLKPDGFSVEWSNINNLLGRKGIRPGSANLVPAERQFVLDRLRVDPEPAHRILHRRQLGQLASAGRAIGGDCDQRRRYL